MKTISATLAIPIYNSEDTVKKQVEVCIRIMKSLGHNYKIILCDDKSTDGTAKVLEKNFASRKNISIIYHKKNLGIAGTCLEIFRKGNLDYVCFYSADGDWDPQDVKKMLMEAYKREADIVIGLRDKSGYTPYRKMVSFFYNLLPLLLFGVKLHDAGSIKVYRQSLFKDIPLISKSIFFEAEMIIRVAKRGGRVVAVPINFHKKERTSGVAASLPNVISSIGDLVKLRLSFRL